ncbi:unnamed protein product [Closterium sp. Yama58-4]|nr:unnamed protein product [Closterium sp. Yama58-4]
MARLEGAAPVFLRPFHEVEGATPAVQQGEREQGERQREAWEREASERESFEREVRERQVREREAQAFVAEPTEDRGAAEDRGASEERGAGLLRRLRAAQQQALLRLEVGLERRLQQLMQELVGPSVHVEFSLRRGRLVNADGSLAAGAGGDAAAAEPAGFAGAGGATTDSDGVTTTTIVFGNRGHFGNRGDYLDGPGLDAFLDQLVAADAQQRGNPPAALSAVDALPAVAVRLEDVESGASCCAVCKEVAEVGEEVVRLPCRHLYHGGCIRQWFAVRNSCPICRFELPTDDEEYEERRRQQREREQMGGRQGEGGEAGRRQREGEEAGWRQLEVEESGRQQIAGEEPGPQLGEGEEARLQQRGERDRSGVQSGVEGGSEDEGVRQGRGNTMGESMGQALGEDEGEEGGRGVGSVSSQGRSEVGGVGRGRGRRLHRQGGHLLRLAGVVAALALGRSVVRRIRRGEPGRLGMNSREE